MAALQYVDVPGYSAVLFRDTNTNLVKPDGLVPRAEVWFTGTGAHYNGKYDQWEFPTGKNRSKSLPGGSALAEPAVLTFSFLDQPRAHLNHKSAAYQFVGLDEAVSIREHQALFMFSRLRRPKNRGGLSRSQSGLTLADVPIRFRAASNPPLPEEYIRGMWVKDRYITASTRSPGTVFIPSKLADNPYLDREEYLRTLSHLDATTRAKLEDGDWDVEDSTGLFRKHWWRIIPVAPDVRPQNRIRFWDLAATPSKEEYRTARKKGPDATAGTRANRTPEGDFHVLDLAYTRATPASVEQLIRETAARDGFDVPIRMEEEPGASGKTTIHYYKRYVLAGHDFLGVPTTKSKLAYYRPLAVAAEAGNVFLVDSPWNADLISQADHVDITGGSSIHDDLIDSVAKAYNNLMRVKRAGTFGAR